MGVHGRPGDAQAPRDLTDRQLLARLRWGPQLNRDRLEVLAKRCGDLFCDQLDGLAERTGKPRPHIGRYEAGAVAPSLDTLLELIRACGFDLPLELAPLEESTDYGLSELQHLSPERRLNRMLDQYAGRKGS